MRRTVAALASAALSVAAWAGPAQAAAPTGKYVALGDSFTSGPLIPNQVDLNCVRSDRNYSHLLRAAIGSAAFTDVSCGGATTADLLAAGSGTLGGAVRAQLAAVTADTALVTVGIGGNDIGFSDIIQTCVTAPS